MKLPSSEIKKIAVFRALQLGDMLCIIPALRALRNAFPAAQISLLGLPWAKALVERFPTYFDSFILFPGYPGLPEQQVKPAAIIHFLNDMQKQQFDLVLQMQGNGTIVNPMVELFGGKYTAGFCIENDYCPDADFFVSYPEGIHEIERHLLLLNHLEIPSQGNHLEFPLTSQDEEEYRRLNLRVNEKKYVCIHPGSRGAWRQWPARHFAALADHCASEGFQVVLTGTKDETEIVDEVIAHMKHEVINTTGKTSLGAVGLLIKNAYALISNCTGVSHMAAAFETPGIVISMDGEPERWGPLNKTLHRTVDWTKTSDFDVVFSELVSVLQGRSGAT
ncbi:MAG: glycosyltransferase family 9 protein [Chitinophagaceae bacterium]